MTEKRRVRVAAVGLGWVTRSRHLPAMERSRRYEVVGVIDRHPGLAAALAAERGYRRAAESDDLGAVPWLDEVDAVTIGAAPMAHHGLATSALALGKHVLTEKPFAMTPQEGRQMVGLAEREGLLLAVVHNFQFARSTRALLRDLEGGRLGRLRSAAGVQLGNPRRRLPHWYDDLPLGLFYDESPHLLYLLERIAGAPLTLRDAGVIPSTLGKRTPAQIHATLAAGSAAPPFTLHCNFESPISEWQLVVLGDQAAGFVDLFRDIYVRLPDDGLHGAWPVLRTSLWATAQHWAQHIPSGIGHMTGRLAYGNDEVFARFAEAILGDPARLAPIDATRALSVLELQHAIVGRSGLAAAA